MAATASPSSRRVILHTKAPLFFTAFVAVRENARAGASPVVATRGAGSRAAPSLTAPLRTSSRSALRFAPAFSSRAEVGL
jgi:hypothetical protein